MHEIADENVKNKSVLEHVEFKLLEINNKIANMQMSTLQSIAELE